MTAALYKSKGKTAAEVICEPEKPERSEEGVSCVPQLQTAQESDISEDKRAFVEWTESKSSQDERVACKRIAAGGAISKPQCQERRQEGMSLDPEFSREESGGRFPRHTASDCAGVGDF